MVTLKPEVPFGETEVLLHTCCAPCSSAIIECLLKNGIRPTIYYCNPNIYPREEYEIRKNECSRYAAKLGLDIIDADYDHENWLCSVARGLEDAPERGPRCLECFRMRLSRTAEYALDNGFRVITTTLASSRWKSLDQINKAGAEAVARALEARGAADPSALVWWDQNWRKGGLQERRLEIIREMDFYNQLYCGCEYSINNH
ncbi:MAG: epoxyqueuosine reductase QueH [Bacteroidales bacterium]|nr:epoxyqueuosine reductase QueH [Bacteroidales bacterium]